MAVTGKDYAHSCGDLNTGKTSTIAADAQVARKHRLEHRWLDRLRDVTNGLTDTPDAESKPIQLNTYLDIKSIRVIRFIDKIIYINYLKP